KPEVSYPDSNFKKFNGFRVHRAMEFGQRLHDDHWLGRKHLGAPCHYWIRDGHLWARYPSGERGIPQHETEAICEVDPDLESVDLTGFCIKDHADFWIAPRAIAERIEEL